MTPAVVAPAIIALRVWLEEGLGLGATVIAGAMGLEGVVVVVVFLMKRSWRARWVQC